MLEDLPEGQEYISIRAAAERLKCSRNALYLEFDKDLTAPQLSENNTPFLLWPQVQHEWRKHKLKPRSSAKEPRKNLTPKNQVEPGEVVKKKTVTIIDAPSQATQVRTALTAVKIKYQQQKQATEIKKEPYALRAERAKAEKEETNASAALIELHLKAKTLMPVDELEDRLRERDSIIRDRLGAMPSWLRELHPGIPPEVFANIEKYLDDTLQKLGKGILTDDERESAQEMTAILEDRDEAEGGDVG